jgi:hypothetical protein
MFGQKYIGDELFEKMLSKAKVNKSVADVRKIITRDVNSKEFVPPTAAIGEVIGGVEFQDDKAVNDIMGQFMALWNEIASERTGK